MDITQFLIYNEYISNLIYEKFKLNVYNNLIFTTTIYISCISIIELERKFLSSSVISIDKLYLNQYI